MRDEDDLRTALRTLERHAPDQDAVLRAVRERAARRPGRRAWIAPLAAAAAVIALLAASIFAAHALLPGTRHPAAAPLPSLADGLPAYFLEDPISDLVGPQPRTRDEGGPPIPSGFRSHETLRVVATATGKVAATATLPGYVAAIAASRAAFYAAVVRDNVARFYEIRLTDSRTGTTVTQLPVRPDSAPLGFMAVSPDGAKLAYSTFVMHGKAGQDQNLVVASTTGGSQREWLTPAQDSQGYLGAMDWLADGRTLAFDWESTADTSAAESLRLLDTAAPGSNLMGGRAVLPSVYESRAFVGAALSASGQVVVGQALGSAASHAPEDSILAFSAATGAETVLYRSSPNGIHGNGCYSPPLWMSDAGRAVLVTCYQGEYVTATPHLNYAVNVVLIKDGRATVLPWLDATAEAVTAFP